MLGLAAAVASLKLGPGQGSIARPASRGRGRGRGRGKGRGRGRAKALDDQEPEIGEQSQAEDDVSHDDPESGEEIEPTEKRQKIDPGMKPKAQAESQGEEREEGEEGGWEKESLIPKVAFG